MSASEDLITTPTRMVQGLTGDDDSDMLATAKATLNEPMPTTVPDQGKHITLDSEAMGNEASAEGSVASSRANEIEEDEASDNGESGSTVSEDDAGDDEEGGHKPALADYSLMPCPTNRKPMQTSTS